MFILVFLVDHRRSVDVWSEYVRKMVDSKADVPEAVGGTHEPMRMSRCCAIAQKSLILDRIPDCSGGCSSMKL
jgi:hypothetical protein